MTSEEREELENLRASEAVLRRLVGQESAAIPALLEKIKELNAESEVWRSKAFALANAVNELLEYEQEEDGWMEAFDEYLTPAMVAIVGKDEPEAGK